MNRIKSAKKQSIDGILFLQGVYKKDCKRVEDFFYERLLHDSTHETKMYDKIPLVFTGIDTWLKSTNLLCWVCNRSFKGRPWFEPQSIDPLNSTKIRDTQVCDIRLGCNSTIDESHIKKQYKKHDFCINIKGNFCSPHCVMRNILNTTKDMSDRLNKIAMLKFVYELFTGVAIFDIQPSPPHTDMIQYGGPMTVQEYQKKIEELGSNYLKLEDDNFINNCKIFMNKFMFE